LAGRSRSEAWKPRNPPPTRNGWWDFRECRARRKQAKAAWGPQITWEAWVPNSPGSQGLACQEGANSESTEPLGGRFLRSRTAKAVPISLSAAKWGCASEWVGWGQISVDGPGQHNPDWSEGPWGRAAWLLEWRCFNRPTSPTPIGDQGFRNEEHEGRRQTKEREGYAGSGLTFTRRRKAPPERPALEPYWGKPAVRNLRGGRGNVGIIRSPVRASSLPDQQRGRAHHPL
jgi:hypothetical protein